MSCNVTDKKSVLKIVAVVAGVAMVITAAAVLLTKFFKKKRKEECYIECDCSDDICLDECNLENDSEVADTDSL